MLEKISGKNWYEFWRNPKNDQKCINRVFDEENNVMYVTETLRCVSVHALYKTFLFRVQPVRGTRMSSGITSAT